MIMKILAPLLLTVSLALGTIAAMTAYQPRLASVEQALAAGEALELGAPSGKTTDPDGTAIPIANAGESLTPDLVARLRSAGVERVRVRQFSVSRWSHRWLFAVSALGLLAGAGLLRSQRRDAVNSSARGSWEPAIAELKDALVKLDARLPVLRQQTGGMREVTTIIGDLQVTHIDTVIQAREQIIASAGLAGFAAFMSAFSLMERQVNRAWSAAADDSMDEVADCLKRAIVLAADVEELTRSQQIPGSDPGN